jgi:hypothetical protein
MLDANHCAFKLISSAQSHTDDATVLKLRPLQSQLRFLQVRTEPSLFGGTPGIYSLHRGRLEGMGRAVCLRRFQFR